jgi:glutathione synthase/RimK-type ligase-like ATP-grasp enzyme
LDSIIDHLRQIKSFQIIRIDPTRPLKNLAFKSSDNRFIYDSTVIDLEQVHCVFCRYALENTYHSEDLIEKLSINENIALLNGFLLNVDKSKWINYPWVESQVEGKIFPLKIAKSIGLEIPEYIVSNNKNSIAEFCKSNKKYVIKMLSDVNFAIQNNETKDIPDYTSYQAPFTSDFEIEKILNKKTDATPMLIQEKIIGEYEWRSVVVSNNEVFSTKIHMSDEFTDSRLGRRNNELVDILPHSINQMLCVLIKKLDLKFCTFDLIELNNKFYLIDINPSGNWLWQEQEPLNLPISKSIVKNIINS